MKTQFDVIKKVLDTPAVVQLLEYQLGMRSILGSSLLQTQTRTECVNHIVKGRQTREGWGRQLILHRLLS